MAIPDPKSEEANSNTVVLHPTDGQAGPRLG